MLWVVGILLITTGPALSSADCDFEEFSVCMREVASLETGDFNVVNEENMKEVCNSKRQAIECASGFIQNCMKKGERDLYEATTGGKLKVVNEMCTEGTKINKGFLQNMGCFGKLQDEISFCNEKFKESNEALNKANMLDRLKVFYGCCAFEWHRNCLAKAARMKCDDQAADFVYHVSTVLGGQVQNQICSSSYSSCHGLHGVDEDDEEEEEESAGDSASNPLPDLGTALVSPLLAWIMM